MIQAVRFKSADIRKFSRKRYRLRTAARVAIAPKTVRFASPHAATVKSAGGSGVDRRAGFMWRRWTENIGDKPHDRER